MSGKNNKYSKDAIFKFLKKLFGTYILIGILSYIMFQTNFIFTGRLSRTELETYENQIIDKELIALEENKLIEIDKEQLKRISLKKLSLNYMENADFRDLKKIVTCEFIGTGGALYKVAQHYYRFACYRFFMTYLNFFAVFVLLLHFIPSGVVMLLDKKIKSVINSIETARNKKESAKRELNIIEQKIKKLNEIKEQNIKTAERIGKQTADDILTEAENKVQHIDYLLDKYIRLEQKKYAAILKKISIEHTIKNTLNSLRWRKDISIHNKMVDKFIKSLENYKS